MHFLYTMYFLHPLSIFTSYLTICWSSCIIGLSFNFAWSKAPGMPAVAISWFSFELIVLMRKTNWIITAGAEVSSFEYQTRWFLLSSHPCPLMILIRFFFRKIRYESAFFLFAILIVFGSTGLITPPLWNNFFNLYCFYTVLSPQLNFLLHSLLCENYMLYKVGNCIFRVSEGQGCIDVLFHLFVLLFITIQILCHNVLQCLSWCIVFILCRSLLCQLVCGTCWVYKVSAYHVLLLSLTKIWWVYKCIFISCLTCFWCVFDRRLIGFSKKFVWHLYVIRILKIGEWLVLIICFD